MVWWGEDVASCPIQYQYQYQYYPPADVTTGLAKLFTSLTCSGPPCCTHKSAAGRYNPATDQGNKPLAWDQIIRPETG